MGASIPMCEKVSRDSFSPSASLVACAMENFTGEKWRGRAKARPY
ncbi:MAG: hypothetical protein ACYDER_17475 [Ktedonobacteraceae bacterium]